MSHDHATVAEEEFLTEIMFWLEEAGLPMTGANVARAMQLMATETVHEMIGRLERDGYVDQRQGQDPLVHRHQSTTRRRRSSAATA